MATASSFALPPVIAMPPAVQRYVATGTPPSAFRRDLVTMSNQIPRVAYAAIALGAAWLAWRSWKSAEGERKRGSKRDPAPEKLTG
jgi:hypothetical protein